MSEPLLTAVVLNYDGRHLLETILPSLAAQTLADMRTVVVDNGSSDDSVAWLAREWPTIDVVCLPENIGVTRALNVCVSVAETEFVALLNNDLELEPDCLSELVGALRAHPEAGSAGGKLLDFGEREVIDGAGDTLTWRGNGHRRGHGERDRGQFEQPRAIFGACGGAALYRRSALSEVGPFDEDFYAFFEDVDWSLRAQVAGFQCRYVPNAVVYHMGSATIGRGLSDFTRYHLWRNGVWLVLKSLPLGVIARHAHQLILGQAINLAVAVRDRKLRIWLRAQRDALRPAPALLRKRAAIGRARRVTGRELEARIAS
ncbi:MAG TPA: glycosyltransferase family 2 protein [Solirubrobacteraceae bacterium]